MGPQDSHTPWTNRSGSGHSHYGFDPDFCHGADPQSKGIVENLCGYAQDDLAIPLLTEAALAGEQAVALTTPIPDDELLTAELARLDRKIDAADAERRRLIDLDQGRFYRTPRTQRRATEVSSRRKELQHKRTSLADERAALARDNQLCRRVHDFARIHTVIDTQKQQLLRRCGLAFAYPATAETEHLTASTPGRSSTGEAH